MTGRANFPWGSTLSQCGRTGVDCSTDNQNVTDRGAICPSAAAGGCYMGASSTAVLGIRGMASVIEYNEFYDAAGRFITLNAGSGFTYVPSTQQWTILGGNLIMDVKGFASHGDDTFLSTNVVQAKSYKGVAGGPALFTAGPEGSVHFDAFAGSPRPTADSSAGLLPLQPWAV